MAQAVLKVAQGAKNNFQLGSILVGLISGAGGFAFDAINNNDYLKLALAVGFMAVVFIMYRDYKIKTAEIAKLKGLDPVATQTPASAPTTPPPVTAATSIPNLKRLE